jgi:hypothetical protein
MTARLLQIRRRYNLLGQVTVFPFSSNPFLLFIAVTPIQLTQGDHGVLMVTLATKVWTIAMVHLHPGILKRGSIYRARFQTQFPYAKGIILAVPKQRWLMTKIQW